MNPSTASPPTRLAGPGSLRISKFISLALVVGTGLFGCATPAPVPPSRPVVVCAVGTCEPLGQGVSTGQLLQALHRLMQRNDGAALRLCEASADRRDCSGGDIGYLVLGGLVLPGRGSSGAATMSRPTLEAGGETIRYVMAMSLRFLGIPLRCADHAAVLAVRSPAEVAITDEAYRCQWLTVAVMQASFDFAIDAIDLDTGRLAGHWRHGVAGMGMGRGAGYAVIEFPKPMPPGENWLVAAP